MVFREIFILALFTTAFAIKKKHIYYVFTYQVIKERFLLTMQIINYKFCFIKRIN